MPFSIVITREGISDAVTAVPSNWVRDDVLHWPKTNKKSEQESLRSNGSSMPEDNWRKQKCRVKLNNIETFEEALQKEEIYAKFNDTDEEETYFHRRQSKKPRYYDTINLNSEFETAAQTNIGDVADTGVMPKSSDKVKILSDIVVCQPSTSKSEPKQSELQNIQILSISADQQNKLITNRQETVVQRSTTDALNITEGSVIDEQQKTGTLVINSQTKEIISTKSINTTPEELVNTKQETETLVMNSQTSEEIFTADMNAIQTDNQNFMTGETDSLLLYLSEEHNKMLVENRKLKEINQKLAEENETLKEENKKARTLEIYHQNVEHRFTAIQVMLDRIITEKASQGLGYLEQDINIPELKFPLESIEELKVLEQKLADKNIETKLIKKFTVRHGMDGKRKLNKVGLPILSEIIKDDCLSLCSWKGIKGCTKTPFRDFVKIREMIYKVICAADRSCSLKDIDGFLQHSALKHSKQRLERKTSKLATAPTANENAMEENTNEPE